MKRILFYVLAVYGLFFAVWCAEAGNPLHYMFHDSPAGQGAYLLSKCLGFLAITAFFVQICLGLASKFGLVDASYRVHAVNGVVLLLFVFSHCVFFALGVSIRSGHVALNVFVPKFNDYFHFMVALGIVSLVGLFTAFILGKTLSRKGGLWSRRGHYVASSFGALSIIHAFSIGSETRSAGVIVLVVIAVGCAGAFFCHEFIKKQISAV